jgi:hypothetical protein
MDCADGWSARSQHKIQRIVPNIDKKAVLDVADKDRPWAIPEATEQDRKPSGSLT